MGCAPGWQNVSSKRTFAEKYYKNSYIYIDLKKEDEVRNFYESTANAEKIIEYLSLRFSKAIDEGTLLIFDEIKNAQILFRRLNIFAKILEKFT